MPKNAAKPLLLAIACLTLAACASDGRTSAYGAAPPQPYEPLPTVTCTNDSNWGLGWSDDCHSRNSP